MNVDDASRQVAKDDGDFGMSEQTGVEAASKAKPKKPLPKPQPSGKQIKLAPGNSKTMIDQLKKHNIKMS